MLKRQQARWREIEAVSVRAKRFDESEFREFTKLVTDATNRLGEALLQATYPTGIFGDTDTPLVAISPAKDSITTQLTVSWKGLFDNQYTTAYRFRFTKRGFDGVEVVRDSAWNRIDSQPLEFAGVQLCYELAAVEQEQKRYEQAIEMYGRGLIVLERLKEQKRLPPANEKWIGITQHAIAECRKLQEGAKE